MNNRKVTKLFAVLALSAGTAAADAPRTLGSGAPACGNTVGKGGPPPECEALERGVQAARVLAARAAAIVEAFAPRTLPSGAPACGNVGAKGPRPASCEAPPAPAAIVAEAK